MKFSNAGFSMLLFRLPKILLMAVWSTLLWASDLSPTQVVQAAVSNVLTDMRNNETLYEKEPDKLNDMVNEQVVPYFDFLRMTQLAMTTSWNSATDAQRKAVTNAFQELFVASYSKQFFAYRNTEAEVQAMPGATDQKATLKIEAQSLRGEKATLFLRLEKKTGQWKIIDVNVEGISYVITSRGQFSEYVATKGIDGLIQYLQEARQNLQ